jgi:hypothetical protein
MSQSSTDQSKTFIKFMAAIAVTLGFGLAACGGSSSDSKEGTALLQKNAALPVTTIARTVATPIFTGPAANKLKSLLGLSSIPTVPLNLGNGVQVLSAEATTDANGAVTAQAVVGFNSGSFTLTMKLTATDSKNWTLTASPGATTPWTNAKVPGLTIDPSTFSGTISSTNGTIAFNLTGGTHSWNVATGATYSSTLAFSSGCSLTPATRCPESVTGPFISMNGALTISGFQNTIAMSGAMTPNAEWARFDGEAGDITFAGTGVKDITLTMWRGARDDSFSSDMQLPALGELASGNNLEFCGDFTLAIPKIGNASTDGCVRWSPSGVVIGQVAVGGSVSGSMPSTGSTATTSADVEGLAYTNISESDLSALPSRDAVMSGVSVEMQYNTVVLAGRATLPGVVADALNIDSSKITSFSVDVTGQVSRTGFSLSGDIKANINIGTEPFKITVREMTLTVTAEKGAGASFSIGTFGNATLGYAPSTRTLSTSIQVVASAAPQMGMSLSVNARGTAAANDSGNDGLTVATRLTNPADAQYVWPDQFGIKGLNLWNLTVQIAFTDGSPALGYTSTTYMDPNGATTKNVLSCNKKKCTGADWMIGSLGLNVSYVNPCLAYSFESASGNSGFVIDKGVLMATSFKVGVAPTGCSIQSGDVQQSLPVGFAGFQFSAVFGDAPGTTLKVATKTSVDGFVFQASVSNLKVAGIEYTSLEIKINITASSSQFSFNADMTSGMGNMEVAADFKVSGEGMTQTLKAELTDWGWKKSDTIDLEFFEFETSADIPLKGGCASFEAEASGSLTVGSRALTLVGANFAFDCDEITNLYLKVLYEHQVKWSGLTAESYLELQYPYVMDGKNYFYGDVGFSYDRKFSKEYSGKTFSKTVDVSFDMQLKLDPDNPIDAGFSFLGSFDADRVSGAVGCSMDTGAGDFTCAGKLRLNPEWAGVYHFNWGEM